MLYYKGSRQKAEEPLGSFKKLDMLLNKCYTNYIESRKDNLVHKKLQLTSSQTNAKIIR